MICCFCIFCVILIVSSLLVFQVIYFLFLSSCLFCASDFHPCLVDCSHLCSPVLLHYLSLSPFGCLIHVAFTPSSAPYLRQVCPSFLFSIWFSCFWFGCHFCWNESLPFAYTWSLSALAPASCGIKSVVCFLPAQLVTKWLENVPFDVTIVTVGRKSKSFIEKVEHRSLGRNRQKICMFVYTMSVSLKAFKMWQRTSESFKENSSCVMTRA